MITVKTEAPVADTIKEVDSEFFRLLGYYAALSGLKPTFRYYLSA